jgi:hypothetical protein
MTAIPAEVVAAHRLVNQHHVIVRIGVAHYRGSFATLVFGDNKPLIGERLKGSRGQSTIPDRILVYALISRWLFPVSVSVLTAGAYIRRSSLQTDALELKLPCRA